MERFFLEKVRFLVVKYELLVYNRFIKVKPDNSLAWSMIILVSAVETSSNS